MLELSEMLAGSTGLVPARRESGGAPEDVGPGATERSEDVGGVDGTRTRGLRRDRSTFENEESTQTDDSQVASVRHPPSHSDTKRPSCASFTDTATDTPDDDEV